MSIVIITEKPSVAKLLAEHLNIQDKKPGYFEGNGYKITWAYGHLVELEEAKSYVENPWLLSSLPIFPNPFKTKIKNDSGVRKQFNVIKTLFEGSTQIINATDAGREGELIYRLIEELVEIKHSNIKRLWLNSFTSEEISKGFKNLKDSSSYSGLYNSAKARNQADWIVGINTTIALTKTLKASSVFSLGRVQTPTYAMVCQRYLENINFKPSPFYVPELLLEKNGIEFKAIFKDNFQDKMKASQIIEKLSNTITCTLSQSKEASEKQPLLFDLTELQRTANRKFGFSADKTLKIAQALYEKHKMITYPRTDSQYLTNSMMEELPLVFETLKGYSLYTDYINSINFEDLPKRSINDNKVTDHHAIIPTNIYNTSLQKDELTIYQTIVKQFIAAFMPEALKEQTTYNFADPSMDPEDYFKSSGSVYIEMGWRALFKNEDKEQSTLPKIEQGQTIAIQNKYVHNAMTKPKPLLTDDSLLNMMKNCGKDFEDVEDKDIKEAGIGTPATRASIIERIIGVNYIQRDKNKLIPTDTGLKLYKLIKDMDIANVTLTGHWENQLSLIEKNEIDIKEFISQIQETTNQYLKQIFSLSNASVVEMYTCPKCNQKTVFENHKAYSCSNDDCSFVVWKNFFGATIDQDTFNNLSQRKKVLMDLLSKENKKFKAYVFLDSDCKTQIEFMSNETDIHCPNCKKNLAERDKFYGCTGFKEGCKFSIPKSICGVKIAKETIEDLLKNKKTSLIKGFTSKAKKKFDAYLVMDPEFNIKFEFVEKAKN